VWPWHWPLTSWSPKSVVLCPRPVDQLCQLASKLWFFTQSIVLVCLVDGRTDGRTDGQHENITPPPAGLTWRRYKMIVAATARINNNNNSNLIKHKSDKTKTSLVPSVWTYLLTYFVAVSGALCTPLCTVFACLSVRLSVTMYEAEQLLVGWWCV